MCSDLLRNIGHTPLLELTRLVPAGGARILAKAEFMNPSGSIKDRIARYIIDQAEAAGALKPGATILEVTSGNTGIAFAMVGAEKGYRVIIMMPKSASVERRKMIESYGAELELLDDLLQIQHAVEKAVDLARRDPHLFLPRQFSNPNNPRAHEETTGREIIEQAGADVGAFVMGVGTGGTLMGVGRALRKVNPAVKVVAVEPAESAVMSGEKRGCHGIQGLADGFIPEIVNLKEVDRIVKVRTPDAIEMAKRLVKEEGLFVGISAGANVVAAIQMARELGEGKKIVTTLPDRGERYLSIW
ncbi:MAG: cysteine synthase A [Planctomycetes bacterium]|nr:cysteine synthase A [Planctomycetota bacterium]